MRELLRTLRREWIPACLALLAVLGAAVGLAASLPEQYRSDATLFIQPADGATAFGSVQAVAFLVPALEARVSSSGLAAQVRDDIPAAASVGWRASATAEPGTGLLRLAVLSTSPGVVMPVADAYTGALRDFVRASDIPLTVSVLDPPSEPVGTGGRRWLSLLPSGVVLGIGAAVVAALLAARIRRPRRIADEIRTRYGLAVLGEVPRLRRRIDLSPLRLYDSEEQGAIEAFMRLRTGIEIEIASRRLTSVTVVSRGLGEGKTTVAAHLGWSLAALGHKIMLADADLRHAGLDTLMRPAVMFQSEQGQPGEVEQHRTSIQKLVYTSARGVRRAGAVAGTVMRSLHPAEAVSAGLPRVLDVAEHDGALVIVDAPPMLAAAESRFIVSVVDATIVVVDASRQLALEDLDDTLRQVTEAGGTVLGVVLNRAKLARPARREEQRYYVRRPELADDRRYRDAPSSPRRTPDIVPRLGGHRPRTSAPPRPAPDRSEDGLLLTTPEAVGARSAGLGLEPGVAAEAHLPPFHKQAVPRDPPAKRVPPAAAEDEASSWSLDATRDAEAARERSTEVGRLADAAAPAPPARTRVQPAVETTSARWAPRAEDAASPGVGRALRAGVRRLVTPDGPAEEPAPPASAD